MKVLLDECLPLDFRHHLPGHEVHTVEFAGLKGLSNGHLLDEAEDAGYDVLLTIDHGIQHQQSLSRRGISVLVIRSRTSQLHDLLPAVNSILQTIGTIRPGQVVVVPVAG
jgi:hypothetical protein